MTETFIPIILHPSGPIGDGPLRQGSGEPRAPGRAVPIVGLDCSEHPDIADALRHGSELVWANEWFGVWEGQLALSVATDGPPAVAFAVLFDPRRHRDVLERRAASACWLTSNWNADSSNAATAVTHITLTGLVTLASAGTVKISVTNTVHAGASFIRAATPQNSQGNNASYIMAVQIA